jgi:hypothetical protein
VKSGATSLELDVTVLFSDDGNDADLASVCLGGRRLPPQLAQRLLTWLGATTQQQLVDEAWANADDEIDDAACDEAREAS